MRPLKITARLLDGRVGTTDGCLPIDGILAAAWIMKEYPDLYFNDGMKHHKPIEAELPLERRGIGDNWYWAASFARFTGQGEYLKYWHKRFDDSLEQYLDMGGRRGKVSGSSGRYKAYRMPMVIMLTPQIEWYCVGDKAKVEQLLLPMTHIGKKTSQGLGAIDQWVVEEIDEDWSERDSEGSLTRALPDEYGTQIYGIRPPYWYPPNQTLCRMPWRAS